MQQFGIELIVKRSQTGATRSGPRGISTLNHEIIDDSMKNDSVIKVLFGELNHPFGWTGRSLLKELEHHVTISFHINLDGPVPCQHLCFEQAGVRYRDGDRQRLP